MRARNSGAISEDFREDVLSVETYKTKWTLVHVVVRFHRQYGGSFGPEYSRYWPYPNGIGARSHFSRMWYIYYARRKTKAGFKG
jgi:hypothetical protein